MPALFRLAVCAIDRPEPVPEAESPVLANCLAAVHEAAERGADLVLLPEEPDIIAGGASGEYPLEEHPGVSAGPSRRGAGPVPEEASRAHRGGHPDGARASRRPLPGL